MWDGEGVVVRIGDIAIIVEVSGQRGGFNENELRLVCSPIRSVTRREIVPGRYGIVTLWPDGDVAVRCDKHSPSELREAAHIFNQIAEVLEENAKGAA